MCVCVCVGGVSQTERRMREVDTERRRLEEEDSERARTAFGGVGDERQQSGTVYG